MLDYIRHVIKHRDQYTFAPLITMLICLGIYCSPPGTVTGAVTKALDEIQARKEAREAATRAANRSTLTKTFLLCAPVFIMLDGIAGWDILYRAFGIDVFPRSPLEKRLREERRRWRDAQPARVREAFFQLERDRLDAAGVRYVEEPIEAPTIGSGLVHPADVRVFYILGEGNVATKIRVAFNVDYCEPEVPEMADRTTRWILTELVESKLAEGKVDMPCKIERVYRDRSDGEHLLQIPQSEAGSLTLANAWDRREGEGLVMKGDMSLETWSEVTMESVVPE